jgi:hypothetical protein
MTVTKETREKVVARLLKLQALAENPGATEGERDAAVRSLGRIMFKYGISDRDLSSAEVVDSAMIKEDVPYMTGSGKRRMLWEVRIGNKMSRVFDCLAVSDYKNDGSPFLCIMGMRADVEIASYFFKFLRRTVYASSRQYSTKVSARNTYAFGMVKRLGERLEEAYKYRDMVAEESDCMDLVHVKKGAVKEYKENEYPDTVKGPKAQLGGSRADYMAGMAAGEGVSLARPITNTGRPSKSVE